MNSDERLLVSQFPKIDPRVVRFVYSVYCGRDSTLAADSLRRLSTSEMERLLIESQRNQKIENFCRVTSKSRDVATRFLERFDWSVDNSVRNFFENPNFRNSEVNRDVSRSDRLFAQRLQEEEKRRKLDEEQRRNQMLIERLRMEEELKKKRLKEEQERKSLELIKEIQEREKHQLLIQSQQRQRVSQSSVYSLNNQISSLSSNERELVGSFCSLTGEAHETAISLLRRCQWKLEIAINTFFDGGASHQMNQHEPTPTIFVDTSILIQNIGILNLNLENISNQHAISTSHFKDLLFNTQAVEKPELRILEFETFIQGEDRGLRSTRSMYERTKINVEIANDLRVSKEFSSFEESYERFMRNRNDNMKTFRRRIELLRNGKPLAKFNKRTKEVEEVYVLQKSIRKLQSSQHHYQNPNLYLSTVEYDNGIHSTHLYYEPRNQLLKETYIWDDVHYVLRYFGLSKQFNQVDLKYFHLDGEDQEWMEYFLSMESIREIEPRKRFTCERPQVNDILFRKSDDVVPKIIGFSQNRQEFIHEKGKLGRSHLEDLYIALSNDKAEYFSLDPVDPQNPFHCKHKKVFSNNEIFRGSYFGEVLFLADYKLKELMRSRVFLFDLYLMDLEIMSDFKLSVDPEDDEFYRKKILFGRNEKRVEKGLVKSFYNDQVLQKEDNKNASRGFISIGDVGVSRKNGDLILENIKFEVNIVPQKTNPDGVLVDGEKNTLSKSTASLLTKYFLPLCSVIPEFDLLSQVLETYVVGRMIRNDFSTAAERMISRTNFKNCLGNYKMKNEDFKEEVHLTRIVGSLSESTTTKIGDSRSVKSISLRQFTSIGGISFSYDLSKRSFIERMSEGTILEGGLSFENANQLMIEAARRNNANINNNLNEETVRNIKVIRRKLDSSILPSYTARGSFAHSGLLVRTDQGKEAVVEYMGEGKTKVTSYQDWMKKFPDADYRVRSQDRGANLPIPMKISVGVLSRMMQRNADSRGGYNIIINNCHMAQEGVRRDLGLKVDNPYRPVTEVLLESQMHAGPFYHTPFMW